MREGVETFSVFLPFWHIRRDIITWIDKFESMVNRMSGQNFHIDAGPILNANWSIYSVEARKDIVDLIGGESRNLGWAQISGFAEIVFECRVPSLSALKDQISPPLKDDGEYLPLWRSVLFHEIKTEVSIIMMALDLCFPGASFIGSYVIEGAGQLSKASCSLSGIEDAYRYADEQGLVRGEDIDFGVVWSFLKSINGLREGVSTTPAGKVINALTYMYEGGNVSMRFFKLVWACYGLEGFFSEGNSARGRQASEKISIFLNLNPEMVGKIFGLLYENRSKFIHGNKALSSALVDIEPPEGKFSIDEWDAEHAGIFFLTETARECVRRNIQRQAFRLILE